jgi:ectoine hydroxylase-related dioxygenase (phytanoyl-CoA dioxygenase family)
MLLPLGGWLLPLLHPFPMSRLPPEFEPEAVAARSEPDQQMYRAERVTLLEPMKSFLESNPEVYFVPPMRGHQWGKWEYRPGAYYDTTIGSKHPYWKDARLPQPSKDIVQLRGDMSRWGYCKVDEAIAADVVGTIRRRVLEQAEGERRAGIAQKTPSGQNINCCVNKGRVFELLIEQDPTVVQGAAVVEQLLTEAMGPGWICASLIAAISLHGGVPQALHQDQGPWSESRSPMSVNVLSAITPLDENSGGTLLIPGSHLLLSEAARKGEPVGKLPPAINLDAPAGTMILTDGRLLHGTGINRHASEPRVVMLNGMQCPWMRQQENWMLSVRSEVLQRASPKLLQRMGFQATTGGQTNEGHGFGASGRMGEPAGALVGFRQAADEGVYRRVGELGPHSSADELAAPFTLREVVAKVCSPLDTSTDLHGSDDCVCRAVTLCRSAARGGLRVCVCVCVSVCVVTADRMVRGGVRWWWRWWWSAGPRRWAPRAGGHHRRRGRTAREIDLTGSSSSSSSWCRRAGRRAHDANRDDGE